MILPRTEIVHCVPAKKEKEKKKVKRLRSKMIVESSLSVNIQGVKIFRGVKLELTG